MMRRAASALLALTAACSHECETLESIAEAHRREPGRGRSRRNDGQAPLPIFMEESGATHSLLYPGFEQSSGSVATWGNYKGIAPAMVDCGSNTFVAVTRRSSIHGLSVADSKLVGNTSTTAGRGWRYNRTNEPEIEDDAASDPYHASMMRTAAGTILLTYERDVSGTPSRSTWYRTNAACDATSFSAATQIPGPGTQFNSAAGPCVELPWGTGTCPGNGCAILCPFFANDTGENRRRVYVRRSNAGLATPAFFQSGTIDFPSTAGGNAWSEPHLTVLPGSGYCGASTSTSCVLAKWRSNDSGNCNIYQSYSRTWGNTWDAYTVAHAGGAWPATGVDSATGYLMTTVRGCPTTGTADAGRARVWTSRNRGALWQYSGEMGDPSLATDPGAGFGGSSTHQQIVRRALGSARDGVARFGVIYGQDGVGSTNRWAYQEIFVGGPPVASEQPFRSTRALDKITTPTPATYATYGAVSALHSQSRVTVAFWLRNNDINQDQDIIRYWNTGNNSHNNLHVRMESTNPHLEVWLPGSVTSFEGAAAANNSWVIDTMEGYMVVFDGAATGNARLSLFKSGASINSTWTTPIPATTTAPTTATFSIGAQGAGSNYLRGGALDQVSIWIGANAPTAAQGPAAAAAWWNGGGVADPTVVAATWGGGAPDINCPLDGSFVCTGLPAPTVNGVAEWTNVYVPGSGFLSP